MTNPSPGNAAGNWQDAHFGEQGGRLTYGDYLQLPGCSTRRSPSPTRPAHDELLFITIHQVYELWFKLMLHELTDARDRMLGRGDLPAPGAPARALHAIERVLVEQVDVHRHDDAAGLPALPHQAVPGVAGSSRRSSARSSSCPG